MEDSGINRLRFAAAQELLDEGARLVDETGRERLSGAPLILAAQATRATHIFESIIALCRIGRGVPGAMLNRALLEEVLDVHWVAAHADQAPDRATDHDTLIGLGERAMEIDFGRPATPLSPAEAERLVELSKEYKNFRLPWTRAGERERTDLISARWGDEAARDIRYVYDVIQRQNNTLLHGSPTAYRHAMSDAPGRGPQINRAGPDMRWRDSLGHGILGYYLVCRVIAEEFGFDKEPAVQAFHLASCLVKPTHSLSLDDFPGDAPCPCESGLAVDNCHRS